jgi:hypothetical protein
LPDEFNRLFHKSGTKINKRNIISIAQAIVVMILGSAPVIGLNKPVEEELLAFPKIAFLAFERIREIANGIPYTVKLKVAIDER